MATIPMVTKTGPRSYTPAEPILGGQLVEGRTGERIGVAAAGSTKVLGVALVDGISPEAITLTPTLIGGRPVLNTALLPTVIGVADSGIEVPVVYAAPAAFGEWLVAASAGRVTPAGAGADPRTLVGKCAEPAGVTTVGAIGLFRTL